MSLAFGGCIQRHFSWHDFGVVQAFLDAGSGMSWVDAPRMSFSGKFTQEHFECARAVHNIRDMYGHGRSSIDTSINRWIRSKLTHSAFVDQLIDLRIALESLYLDDTHGELRFRLASYGTWHIGESFEERKMIYLTLKEAYNLSSKAVHSGEASFNDNNKQLLQEAQQICRRGILKRLKENAKPDWEELILGSEA